MLCFLFLWCNQGTKEPENRVVPDTNLAGYPAKLEIQSFSSGWIPDIKKGWISGTTLPKNNLLL